MIRALDDGFHQLNRPASATALAAAQVSTLAGTPAPQRAQEALLVLCPAEEVARHLEQLRSPARLVVDLTSALAGFQVTGGQLLRRLTDLDLDALPAVGAVAHVPETLLRDGDEFRLFFPQEYADHVAEVVLDAAAGLR